MPDLAPMTANGIKECHSLSSLNMTSAHAIPPIRKEKIYPFLIDNRVTSQYGDTLATTSAMLFTIWFVKISPGKYFT